MAINRRVSSAQVLAFIAEYLRTPEGELRGQPLRLAPFQVEYIEAVFDGPVLIRRAFLSTGKKNGKSSLIAALLLCFLAGPAAIPGSQLYSSALTRLQAALVFDLAVKMIRMHPDLVRVIRVVESSKTLHNDELNIRYRALSSDAPSVHGVSPALCIHDELGQVEGETSELYSAVETAMVGQSSPLSLIISTQASSDTALLSALLDKALEEPDPATVVKLCSVPADHQAPFSIEALELANQALGWFLDPKELLAGAAQAQALPSFGAAFRNFHLNQRVAGGTPFLTAGLWAACNGAPRPGLAGGALFGGLDLSSKTAFSSLVLTSHETMGGPISVLPYFWLPAAGARGERSGRTKYAAALGGGRAAPDSAEDGARLRPACRGRAPDHPRVFSQSNRL
jgi:phage terminase large subunit-like protein